MFDALGVDDSSNNLDAEREWQRLLLADGATRCSRSKYPLSGGGSSHHITPQQTRALEALLAGATKTKAAQVAGVARETVTRWSLSDPPFVAAWRCRQAELWEASRALLEEEARERVELRRRAVQFLGNLLDDEQAPLNERARAARALAGLKVVPLPDVAPARETTADQVEQQLIQETRFRVESRASSLQLEAAYAHLRPATQFLEQANRELSPGQRYLRDKFGDRLQAEANPAGS